MGISTAKIASILNISRDQIQSMSDQVCGYLTKDANPPRGTPRRYSLEDVRVLAYVSYYWEDEPDLDYIKCGLNTDNHHEEIYDNLISSITPLFQDPPEGLDETWRGVAILNSMGNDRWNLFSVAESYKQAGDILVAASITDYESWQLLYCQFYLTTDTHSNSMRKRFLMPPRKHTTYKSCTSN